MLVISKSPHHETEIPDQQSMAQAVSSSHTPIDCRVLHGMG